MYVYNLNRLPISITIYTYFVLTICLYTYTYIYMEAGHSFSDLGVSGLEGCREASMQAWRTFLQDKSLEAALTSLNPEP